MYKSSTAPDATLQYSSALSPYYPVLPPSCNMPHPTMRRQPSSLTRLNVLSVVLETPSIESRSPSDSLSPIDHAYRIYGRKDASRSVAQGELRYPIPAVFVLQREAAAHATQVTARYKHDGGETALPPSRTHRTSTRLPLGLRQQQHARHVFRLSLDHTDPHTRALPSPMDSGPSP